MDHKLRQAYYLMGTLVEVIAYIDSFSIDSNLLLEKAFTEFERIEKTFSYFDQNSELSRVNSQASIHPIKVSKEFFHVVSLAVSYMLTSQETFSIMLSPLTQLWHKATIKNKIPNTKTIKTIKKLTNPNLLVLNPSNQTIFFQKQGVAIDLSGFVKGYAVDCVKKTLSQLGVSSGMINAGSSSITAWGLPLGKDAWQLGVKHVQNNTVIAILNLTSNAISTSGTSERFFTIQNKNFSYLLNPKTGYPLIDLISATVLCPSALEAEVISKMLLFLGQEETLNCCEKNGWPIDSLLVQKLNSNNTYLSYTDNLPVIF
ncbi:MAG: thiamine biosynthesis lipoprotein [bacterium]|nr:MAG: thiamine biosynthesis lipoprotein [bacterium]